MPFPTCTNRPETPSGKGLEESVERSIAALRGTKRIDLFQPARVARDVPIEETIRTLVALKEAGKFDHIGLSECSAATLRRAHAVSSQHMQMCWSSGSTSMTQVHPIAVAEIEVSLVAYEEETKNGTRHFDHAQYSSVQSLGLHSPSGSCRARHCYQRLLVRF